MTLHKIMRTYYVHRLSRLPSMPSPIWTEGEKITADKVGAAICWHDVIGWVMIAASIIHFLFRDHILGMFRIVPRVTCLF